MHLNYDKIRERVEQGAHQWTSYSDLFLVLSMTFLLLYVVASLRSGSSSIAQNQALQDAKEEVEALKKQIKAYEVLKDDYLKNGASKDEIQVYQDLMAQLNLLEDTAKKDHDKLSQQAREAREKKEQLNHYQELVKNIINANLVSTSKLKKRDTIIESQSQELTSLDEQVRTREKQIAKNNQEIANIQEELERKSRHLRLTKEHSAELEQIQRESEAKIMSLRSANEKASSELTETRTKLDEKTQQTQKLVGELSRKEGEYKGRIEELHRQHETELAASRMAFEAGLRKAHLGAQAKIERERKYRAEVERQNQAYQNKLQGLNGELEGTRSELGKMASQYKSASASLEKFNEQRRLAKQMKENFEKNGINADVDLKTGEVTIQFGNEYFETDQASMRPGMKHILEKTIPSYAQSLFQDPKLAKRIATVEIVGFASPTFQGKAVDPSSLSPQDRAAVNYNMDLSYRRAKAVFEHAFNPDVMKFDHQKDLLPLVKVSGRSYLGNTTNRNPANSRDEFCTKNDCKKSQVVIIKFNLKEEQ